MRFAGLEVHLDGLTTILVGGLMALLLLLLMLRFALRPRLKKQKTPTSATGVLGLSFPSNQVKASSKEPLSTAFSGARVVSSGPAVLAATEPEVAGATISGRSPASSGSEPGDSGWTWPGGVTTPAVGATAASPAAEEQHATVAEADSCPKCGGRFLVGEMEGPTLLIDGVVREEFQPLLAARECSECGYLEFYARPARR
jgi:predicted nucleic-acid-binding Zn-ribbon protein